MFEENTHEGQLEEKTLLGIFNRMLNNGMIFANLYPNENNLSLDAEGLFISMEYMSFGSYNYETLSEEPRQKTTETKWRFENGRFVLLENRETFE